MEIAVSSSSRPVTSSVPKPMITQAQLAEMNRLRELEREGKALRQEIVELLIGGAEIEPGPLTAWLQHQRQQRPTWDGLVELLGSACIERLREEIEATVIQILKIGEQES